MAEHGRIERSFIGDERSLNGRYRMAGLLGPMSSTFTLAWLASHRDRLRTLALGGKRLSVLVVWDTKGLALADRSDDDVDAVYQLVYGSPASRDSQAPKEDA